MLRPRIASSHGDVASRFGIMVKISQWRRTREADPEALGALLRDSSQDWIARARTNPTYRASLIVWWPVAQKYARWLRVELPDLEAELAK